MQSSLIEVKSASDIMLLRIENHSKKKLYKKCLKLIGDGKFSSAIDLILEQDYASDSTLCVLLSKCLCPTFPNINLDDEELDLFDEIPTELQKLLDENNDRSDENLDHIIESYYDNKDNLSRNSDEALRLIELAANLGDEIARSQLLVEWHLKLSHFEENLHPNLSHPNRLSCLIFEQGWARSYQRGNFEQITQTCPSRQGLHPTS